MNDLVNLNEQDRARRDELLSNYNAALDALAYGDEFFKDIAVNRMEALGNELVDLVGDEEAQRLLDLL